MNLSSFGPGAVDGVSACDECLVLWPDYSRKGNPAQIIATSEA